jgi:hypothetical protein
VTLRLGSIRQSDRASFGLRRPSPVGDVEEVRTRITNSLADGKVDFSDVLRTRYWQTFRAYGAREWRRLGNQYYDQLLTAFIASHGPETDVGMFGRSGLGAYKTDSKFQYLIVGKAIRFDWSEGQTLLQRIDGVAERAREWWGPTADGKSKRRKQTAIAERQRFLDRALGLISSLFAAIDQENPPDWRVAPAEQSDSYRKRMQALTTHIDEEERGLQDALQRSAQMCYGRGMFFGAIGVVFISTGLGAAFWLGDVAAAYGVAFPAGAAGAIVSVLQRMSSSRPASRLSLDFNAGQQMLTYYGAIRPFIGGLLGFMIFVFLKGSLFPALSITTNAPLATFAGLGFLGGFNERWAQDMIAGSAKRLEQDSG